MFKRKKGIDLSYEKQGLVYFICQNYRNQPEKTKRKIERLCEKVTREGEYIALFQLLTDKSRTLERIAADNYISAKRLARLRKEFYERWYRER